MPSRAFPPTSTPNPNPSNPIFKARVLFLVLTISASVILLIAVLVFFFYLYHSLINHSKTIPYDSNTPLKLQKFSYKELRSATNVFNEANSIGKGGSGTVFRGILRDGKSVAVKKLDASSLQAEREFQNELQILGEGDFGIDLFSQELGQELSGNLAAIVPEETPTISTPAESSANEVNFALALQSASTSSSPYKNNRVDYNAKTLNLNGNGIGAGVNDNSTRAKGSYHKGKEISIAVIDGEDWNKFVPYDDELCSIYHSKELNPSDMSTPVDDPTASKKQWGKDWWWKQDGSGELCSKDYVKEWIGSQICPSGNPDWDEGSRISPVKIGLDTSMEVDKLETRNLSQLEKPRFKCSKKMSEKKDMKSGKTCNNKHRKMQEWWKEEHLEEISKKSNKLKKLESKWKKGIKIQHFNLCHKFQFGKNSSRREQNQSVCDLNGEFSFRKGWKKKKSRSGGSEMWSGDLFSRELSSTTSMRGTVCYVAPEYGGCGYLMEKADIYSLGVLILVIVSGRRPLHVLSSPMKLEKANLISWCRHLAQAGSVLELLDDRLKNRYNKDQVTLCINLALMCLQKMPELRPDIVEIVKILKGEMDLPALPIEFSPSPPSKLFSRSRRRTKPEVE
ncbi:hypothetical protein IFM89_003139 [Coptis chinensis]|uniref:Protein kinase domain-containing protein n=1 Tax=Coptis chinensis TaxID=261450 RepID=A0A835I980_9MAGN|nr:hypothetical protein IFM89_003139 [Coptis chinensis]